MRLGFQEERLRVDFVSVCKYISGKNIRGGNAFGGRVKLVQEKNVTNWE